MKISRKLQRKLQQLVLIAGVNSLGLAFGAYFLPASAAHFATLPVSAVSFPKEAIPVTAGKIEFWAKLSGFSGPIPTNGPYFFRLSEIEPPMDQNTFEAGFNNNDGTGNGGLVGRVGRSVDTGTGPYYDFWTYENVLGSAGQVDDWHQYTFQWNKNGIPGVDNGQRNVAVFVDGILNSNRWDSGSNPPQFDPFTAGTLNLISGHTLGAMAGEVAIDEFKIYDGDNNLLLWNTLGSATEIAQSEVGLNGSFNGGGNAHFVPGISGNAVMARAVNDVGPVPEPPPHPVPEPTSTLGLLALGTLGAASILKRKLTSKPTEEDATRVG